MNSSSQPWSRAFLLVWTLLPVAIVLGGVLRLHELDLGLTVSVLALALAGLWLPLQYRHRENPPAWPLGLLLLFLAPAWVGAGRLSGADWRGGVALLVVAMWLALPWALSRWRAGDAALRLHFLQCVFVTISALPPLLSFLSRNFGGADWPRLAAVSPFAMLVELQKEGGGDWKIGAIASGLVLALAYLRARATQAEAA